MIQIIEIENPFERRKKERTSVYTGNRIDAYTDITGRDVFLNGHRVDKVSAIPQDGDQIITVPHVGGDGIGKVLGFVAMIALTVYSGSVAGGLWAKAGTFFAKGAVGSILASGAIMYLGGRLINSIFPQQAATLDTSWHESEKSTPTYGWDLPSTYTNEGGIIGETYGECIPAPQLLEEHIETVGDQQYLNLIYCGGYGPVDSIDNIRIDYTGISNFTGVTLETRLGTNEQEPISFFKNTPLDQSVGLELAVGSPLVRTSNSPRANGLEITLEWPGGLYHLNDDGSYGTATVGFMIYYRKTGATDWKKGADSYSASAASSSTVRKSYTLSGLDTSRYDVKVELTSMPTGSRYCTTTQWTIMTSYVDGTYNRPGKVLVAMRILATNQLSGGVPNVNWHQKRNTVYVWNPNTGAYEERAANNPIWAAYDIMHGCKKLKNINTGEYEYVVYGATKETMSSYFEEWKSAAAYADEEIVNHDGEKEKRFEFDAYFDTEQKRIEAAQKAASVGHAAIIRHGRNYGVVVDMPGTISQIFGEGRTTVSSIKGSFSSKDERARAVEITYNDQNNDFKNTMFTVRSTAYNDDVSSQDNTAKLTLFGVKRRSQAYREAICTLATNERQLQFVELSADIDAIVTEYGDIVGLNHAVANIGIASGRLEEATSTTVTLDKNVVMEAGKTYEIYIQLDTDEIIKREIAAADGSSKQLTVSLPFDTNKTPVKYNNYSFGGTSKAVKPFRIVNASRNGDLLVNLKLAEYDDAIYSTELDYSKYPIIDYTSTAAYGAQNLTAKEHTYMQRDGTSVSDIIVSWDVLRGSREELYHVYLMESGGSYIYKGSASAGSFTIGNVKTKTDYYVAVKGVYGAIEANTRTAEVYITGKDSPPNDVTRFDVVQSGQMMVAVIGEVSDNDLAYYEIRQGASWEKSTLIGTFIGTKYEFAATDEGTITYYIKARDTSGNYSERAAKSICNVSGLPEHNVIYERDIPAAEWDVTGMWRDTPGYFRIAEKKTLADYAHFSDIFGGTHELRTDAVILLSPIDLGENMLDTSCFWKDADGKLHLKSTKTLADYAHFSDIFGSKQEYMKLKYQNSTFSSVAVNYELTGNAKYTVEYRTSVDAVAWSDWIPESVKQFAGRFIQIRVIPESIDGIGNIIIKGVTVTIDVPDIEDIIENVTLSATETTTIQFNKKFKEIKSFSAYTDLSGRQVTCLLENRTTSSIDVSALDDNGNRLAATLQKLVIRGY